MGIVVTVPGSSANLGPGFDCLAVALPLKLRVEIDRRPGPLTVAVSGEGADELPADASNLVVRTLLAGTSGAGLDIRISNELPLAAGCGSSAAALVAGLAAADALAGRPLDRAALAARATAIEGHPDNVGASVYGGFTIALSEPPLVRRLPPPAGLALVLVVPPERLATTAARAALPAMVSRADAVWNLQRVALLVAALASGRLGDLRPALRDRLHEPARAPLAPALARLAERLEAVGALGVTLSGAGPSVLLWCLHDQAAAVASAAAQTAPGATVSVLRPAPDGVSVEAACISQAVPS